MNKKLAIISIMVLMIAYLGLGIYSVKSGRPSLFAEKLNKEKRLLEIGKVNAEIKNKFDNEFNAQSNEQETKQMQQVTEENSNNTQETVKTDTFKDVTFTRNLAQGVQGDDVKKLQFILKNKGFYDGEVTGIYDFKTVQAVKNFQKEFNIKQTGIVGPATIKEVLK